MKAIPAKTDRKKILDNFLSLSTLQSLNILLPLLTFPYLARILGAEKFGAIAFAQALALYGTIIAEYGFPFSATQRAALCRSNRTELSELFFSVSLIRILLAFSALLIFLSLTAIIPQLQVDLPLYLLAWLSVAGTALMPGWFFQAVDRMRALAIISSVPRIFFTIMVFVLIHSAQDYRLVPLLGGIGAVSAAILSLLYIHHKKLIIPAFPRTSTLIRDAREGLPIFISTLAASVYALSNTTILGFTSSAATVAWYAGAERVLRIGLSFLQSFSQAIFPRMGITAHEDGMAALAKKIRRLLIPGLAVALTGTGALYLTAPLIVSILMGTGFTPSVHVLRILSPVIPLVFLGTIFGIQSMLPLGHSKSFSAIMIAGAFGDIVLCLILIPRYSYIGAAIAWTSTECIVVVLMVIFLFRIDFFKTARLGSLPNSSSPSQEAEGHKL